MTEGHAQELKTQAMALQVGKRLRVMLSDNNAGIDDVLLGGVIAGKLRRLRARRQWTSYGWNVLTVEDGGDYDQVVAALKTMENWDPERPSADDHDRQDDQGILARAPWTANCRARASRSSSYQSHPYGDEDELRVFRRPGRAHSKSITASSSPASARAPVTDSRERLIQFKTNIDIAMSVLDRNGLGDWLAERLVTIGDRCQGRIPAAHRCEARSVSGRSAAGGQSSGGHRRRSPSKTESRARRSRSPLRCSASPAKMAGARRAISEIIKWMNYVTENRFLTLAADLSESINVEHGSLWGHYDPETNPLGTRIKASIQEAGNVVDCDRHGQPERERRSGEIRRRLGAQRHLWRLHAADVHALARLEPAEPGQQISHGRAAHSGRTFGSGNGGRRAHPFRHFRHAGLEAVSARSDHPPEFLGLQRRCRRLFCRRRDRRARSQGRHHLD